MIFKSENTYKKHNVFFFKIRNIDVFYNTEEQFFSIRFSQKYNEGRNSGEGVNLYHACADVRVTFIESIKLLFISNFLFGM